MEVMAKRASDHSSLPLKRILAPGRRRALTGYLLTLPAVLAVLGLIAYPIFEDLRLSLLDARGFSYSGDFVGLANYVRLVQDPLYWQAVKDTVFLVGVTALAEMTIGLLTALLLWWKFWGRAIVFLAVFIPWAYPSSFSGFSWYWLFSPPFWTAVTHYLLAGRWFVEGIFGPGAWGVLSIMVMNVWRGGSIIAILLLAGLNAIPEELLDYGRLESRSGWSYFWRVVTPLYWRFFALASIVALVITYMDIASMYVETGGRILVPVIGTLSYQQAVVVGNAGYGAALVLTQIPLFALLAYLALRLVERRPESRTSADSWHVEPGDALTRLASSRTPIAVSDHRPDWFRHRSRRLAWLGAAAALAIMVFHIFPLYYTAIQALRPDSEIAIGNPFWAYHPDWAAVRNALSDPVIWQWAQNTLWVYVAVLGLGLALSLAAGYGLARFRPPGGRWLARLLFVSYFVPQMAIAIPSFQVFSAIGLDNTKTGIVLLYLTLVVPFCTWLFYSYFLGLDTEIEEQAWLDGSRLSTFFRIVLPMSWPVVIAAALFAVGMMGSDLLYGPLFTLSNTTKTLGTGLGLTAIDLDEWTNVNAAILVSALPVVIASAALGRYYVKGLQAALVEGS